ncbi:MAG: hypothetical protein II747_05240 [Clostridia bacterium]|nr:hypothetical protein [Clostridia bacterium]
MINNLLKSALTFCLFTLCLGLAACCKCGNERSAQATNTAAPNETGGTKIPTDIPVEPTESYYENELEYDGEYKYKPSRKRWFEKTAHAIIEGRFSDIEYPNREMQRIVFIADEPIGTAAPEYVNAFSASLEFEHGGDSNTETIYFDQVMHIPYGTAVNAENRLYDLMKERGLTQTSLKSGGAFNKIEGFCGEDWFMLQSEGVADGSQYMHTIWRRDDSGNWYEFGSNNKELAMVVDANFISDKTGFMCCYSPAYADIQGENRLQRFFATFDGGDTWQDMELYPSYGYENCSGCTFYGPVFEDDIGVVLIDVFSKSDLSELNPTVNHDCFVTEDGGHTWKYVAL